MTYTKTQWENGVPPALSAENLNKIEQGIFDNEVALADKAAASHTHAPTDLTSVVPINKGGTGSDTASEAFYNLVFKLVGTTPLTIAGSAISSILVPFPTGYVLGNFLCIGTLYFSGSGTSSLLLWEWYAEASGVRIYIKNTSATSITTTIGYTILLNK